MPRQRKPETDRKRLTFDVDSSFLKLIEEAARHKEVSIREFCLQAIGLSLTPEFQFHSLEPGSRLPLKDFLTDAREITMTGITLPSLWQETGLLDFLKERITKDRVPMSFIILDIMDPDHAQQSPVQQLWNDRYQYRYREGLRAHQQDTLNHLWQLYEAGRSVTPPVRVGVKGTRTLPACGMVVADPGRRFGKMRVKLYLETVPHGVEPFFEIHARGQEGGKAFEALMEHLRYLEYDAIPINLSPPENKAER